MKTVKHKPYSKTSYLPNSILLTDKSPLSEHQQMFALQKKELNRLQLIIEHKEKIIEALTAENEKLKAVNKGQRDALFGRSSEKQSKPECTAEVASEASLLEELTDTAQQEAHALEESKVAVTPTPLARRGARFGHKGHGRKIPMLPEIELIHEVPAEACCSVCRRAYADTGLTEESYQVHVETKLVRIKHVRKRSFRTCECDGPRFMTASKPPQVIPKGMFSHAFLAYVLVMKFFFQIPLHRLLSMLQMRGLTLNESTLVGNFKALNDTFAPLYNRLVQINKEAKHWNVDETGWKIFAHTKDKLNFNWWMWIFACKQTVVYLVDATRAGSVLMKHFGTDASGIVSSDRFSAYSMLSRLNKGLINAFCWAHFRRDFIKAGKEYKDLKAWAEQWLGRILQIYRLNRQRLAVLDDPVLLPGAQSSLEQGLAQFLQQIDAELKSSDLHDKKRAVLKSARKNWTSLTVFAVHAHVPMDNNRAERLLRLAALGRKNYYGCHAQWSGDFTAICLTIMQTASMHGLNMEAYMRYILDELAIHQNKHPDIDSLLPWNIPESQLQAYNMKAGGLPCKSTTFPETSAVGL